MTEADFHSITRNGELCDGDGGLGPREFELVMRKQVAMAQQSAENEVDVAPSTVHPLVVRVVPFPFRHHAWAIGITALLLFFGLEHMPCLQALHARVARLLECNHTGQ